MSRLPHSIDICEGALAFVVGQEMDVKLTRRIGATMRILDYLQPRGIYECVPSYASIMALYDETIVSRTYVSDTLHGAWNSASRSVDGRGSESITIDVVYGDIYGEDLTEVSAFAGKSVDEVITLHASGEYTVGAVGFTPGFTYLIGLPPELAVPRRESPRLNVPPGSVGIGGAQTGVYSLPSAGGWNLIGRSPTRLFDPLLDDPVRLKLGDRLRFRPVQSAKFDDERKTRPGPMGDGGIEITRPGMQTTVQDLGRYGYGRSGFATDGATDRSSLAAANRLVANPDSAAALECTLVGPALRFHRRYRLSLAGADLGALLNGRPLRPGRVFETMPGDELTFQRSMDSAGARAYLAVAGGFDVPLALGSASTNLVAGIGGWYGRALVAGDRLESGQGELPTSTGRQVVPGRGWKDPTSSPFWVVPGPQWECFSDVTWQRLLNEPFTVTTDANRVGIRLAGPDLSAETPADVLSEGIVTGSIQVTGQGQAIVMLPGHATIGGYTLIATVVPADWDRLGQLTPGDVIRFAGPPRTDSDQSSRSHRPDRTASG